MDTRIVAVNCLCDDILKVINHWDYPQTKMTDAEVMTIHGMTLIPWSLDLSIGIPNIRWQRDNGKQAVLQVIHLGSDVIHGY